MILKEYVDQLKNEYDYVIIDCMPSLGLMTINALACADSVIIPVQAAFLPAKGLTQLLQMVRKVQRQLNPSLKIEGVLFTMGLNTGVELSYLTEDEQNELLIAMSGIMLHHPSLSQAKRLKELHKGDRLTPLNIEAALMPERQKLDALVFSESKIRSFFPQGTAGSEIMDTIYVLLENWKNAGKGLASGMKCIDIALTKRL